MSPGLFYSSHYTVELGKKPNTLYETMENIILKTHSKSISAAFMIINNG